MLSLFVNSRTQFELFSIALFPAAVFALLSLQMSSNPVDFAPTTPSFSTSSALFPKRTYLTENTTHNQFYNSFNFNHFRTLFHSSPATPLFTICSPKHTRGVPTPLTISRSGNRSRRLHARAQ